MSAYRNPFQQWLWESGAAYVLLVIFGIVVVTCMAVIACCFVSARLKKAIDAARAKEGQP